MSYCRWSSDDFQCDLYCYEDCTGGWTTHVARNKLVPKEPLPPKIAWKKGAGKKAADAWVARHNRVNEILKKARRVNLKLPLAGESFNDPTLEKFLERVISLRAIGYRCPDSLIEIIFEEIKEAEATATMKGIMRCRIGKRTVKNKEFKEGWLEGRDAAITAVLRRIDR